MIYIVNLALNILREYVKLESWWLRQAKKRENRTKRREEFYNHLRIGV